MHLLHLLRLTNRKTLLLNSATNAMETNRVKERVFKYMSYFDRFTKLKRNDEIEVSVPLISFAI